MFFYKKKSTSGEVLQLLESYRNRVGKATHRVVVSLGNAGIPETSWKSIAKYVESELYGYRELFQAPKKDQWWIDQILRRIEREGRWQPLSIQRTLVASRDSTKTSVSGHSSEIVDGVLVDDIDHTHDTTLGPELVALAAWRNLGMDELLRNLGLSSAQCRAAACSVVNRLVQPVSENALPYWLETSSLPDILGEDCLFCGHDKYYKITDEIIKRQEQIEKHLSVKIARHFDFRRTYILYDLTNTHFEGNAEENPKAKRGRNKQKRHDCPQIVVGVCFDEHGFVLFHKTFAGNTNDSVSLADMVTEMQTYSQQSDFFSNLLKPLVIVDAGIATKDNLALLRQKGFSYLVNAARQNREQYVKYFNEKERFTLIKNADNGPSVQVRELDLVDGEVDENSAQNTAVNSSSNVKEADADYQPPENDTQNAPEEPLKERLVLCRSEPRKEKESAMLSGAEEKFIQALQNLSKRIKTGKLKDSAKIERNIGAIQGRHPRVSKYYTVRYVESEIKAKPASEKKNSERSKDQQPPPIGDLVYERKDEADKSKAAPEELLGCYVLRTDRCDLSAKDLWHLYMTLTKAENGFRALKSDCGLRPNCHRLEHRVDAHIFISILAYQLQRFIQYQLESVGDHRCWKILRRVLQTHTYSTLIVPTKEGIVYRIRKPGRPEECQLQIYNSLRIDLSALPRTKIAVKKKSSTL